ncbi:DUF3761 domain-containing protein [Granulicella paludicola]|uniref:DUF3761 domain-containing protein n=1 Tax=Granulicella paludicola TaxID=474951 RepID=UPI0037BF7693
MKVITLLGLILPFLVAAQQPTPRSSGSTSPPSAPSVGPSNGRHYTNSSGQLVHSPMGAPSAPAGATAKCGDGTYSFSQHARGTCSHHGSVAFWLIH